MRLIYLTIFVFTGFVSFGQTKYATQDSAHIFWQPDVQPTYNDYQGKGNLTDGVEALMNKYGFSASASVGIWSILDVPKKVRDRYRKFEKVYFAPAFDKKNSFAKTDDTLQIAMQNLYFDICELWARWARKELKSLQDTMNATGTLSIWYMTIKKRMNESRLATYQAYFRDVFVDKKEGAFTKWKQEINRGLEDTKMWATTPQECYRLMSGKPIETGYIQAPKVVRSLDD